MTKEFTAYLDRVKASKLIVIHRTECGYHKSHEGHDEEWFYEDSYQEMREFAEKKAKENSVDVHDCKVCKPEQ